MRSFEGQGRDYFRSCFLRIGRALIARDGTNRGKELPMHPTDLALFTTEQLIDELLRRPTFLGVVVHSEREMKGKHWGQERVFKVRFNENLDSVQTGRLLGTVAEHLDQIDE